MALLSLLPPALHRLGYRLAFRARREWYRRVGGTLTGCSVIGRDGEGRFLLVRHSYGPAVWTFPGGGIRRRETPRAAALREMREELGCGLVDLRLLTTFTEPYLGASNLVHVFTALIDGEPRPDGREILEARFFARDAFPTPISRMVAPRMDAFDAHGAAPRQAG